MSDHDLPLMTLRCDECRRLVARVYPAVVDGVECLVCRACRDASIALVEQAFEQAAEKVKARMRAVRAVLASKSE